MPYYGNPIEPPFDPNDPFDPNANGNSVDPPTTIAPWKLPSLISIDMLLGGSSTKKQDVTVTINNYIEDYAVDTLDITWSYSNADAGNLSQMVLSGEFTFGVTTTLTAARYGSIFVLGLKIENTQDLAEGVYDSEIQIVVKEISTGDIVETKTIPVVLNVKNPGTISTNIDEPQYLFCLDENVINIESKMGRFVDLFFTITFKELTYSLKSRHVIYRDLCEVNVGKEIQPYVYLSAAEIESFFTAKNLDMKPALVDLKVSIYDEDFNEILFEEFTSLKFHAGKSKNIPEDGSTVERSLSWNTWLPLAYRYPFETVTFKYKEYSKSYNKQANSEEDNIFQMMFIQKYHFANESGISAGFSNGFSSGFATVQALLTANPLYKYDQNYLNLIESAYTIKGINFPWQTNSINVFWLDENNNFNGITFTGHNEKNVEFSHFINDLPVYFQAKKAGYIRTKKMSLNTGWKLLSETEKVLELMASNRCWIFGDDPTKKIEAVCISEKLQEESSMRELNEFTLEFIINE